ncbi:MAG: binding 1 protein [Bacteroidota bacterium]|nr:binding 1 protein [Bacteroidota bacterium]
MNIENNTNNNQDKKGQNIFVSLLLIILFIGGLTVYAKYYKGNVFQKNEEVKTEEVSSNLIKNCGLTIKGPLENGSVGQTFVVDAVLDNSEREILGCSWTAFEAQTGVVYVKDGTGKDLAKPTPLTTIEEWMTDAPVNYFANISILNNYTGPALVIINEEDPSGEKDSKTISFPVVITQ